MARVVGTIVAPMAETVALVRHGGNTYAQALRIGTRTNGNALLGISRKYVECILRQVDICSVVYGIVNRNVDI